MTDTRTSNTKDHESAHEDEGIMDAYEIALATLRVEKGTKYHNQCHCSLIQLLFHGRGTGG